MMRGEHNWAVAVRTPDGDIERRGARRARLGRQVPQDPDPARRDGARRSRSASATARSRGRRTSRCPKRSRSPRRRWAWRSSSRWSSSARSSSCCPRSPAARLDDSSVVPAVPPRRRRRATRRCSSATCSRSRHPRHPARVPVPRRRAQDDRGVRERRRAHARVGATVHDRARALRHELPAHRDGRRDRRVLASSRRRTCSRSSCRASS